MYVFMFVHDSSSTKMSWNDAYRPLTQVTWELGWSRGISGRGEEGVGWGLKEKVYLFKNCPWWRRILQYHVTPSVQMRWLLKHEWWSSPSGRTPWHTSSYCHPCLWAISQFCRRTLLCLIHPGFQCFHLWNNRTKPGLLWCAKAITGLQ